MHELSIAAMLFEQVTRHTPPGAIVRSIRVLIGPMQGIEPESLRFGWDVVCRDGGIAVPEMILDLPGWKLSCEKCGRRWESAELYVQCACGNPLPHPEGGSELQLISIEVQEPDTTGEPNG